MDGSKDDTDYTISVGHNFVRMLGFNLPFVASDDDKEQMIVSANYFVTQLMLKFTLDELQAMAASTPYQSREMSREEQRRLQEVSEEVNPGTRGGREDGEENGDEPAFCINLSEAMAYAQCLLPSLQARAGTWQHNAVQLPQPSNVATTTSTDITGSVTQEMQTTIPTAPEGDKTAKTPPVELSPGRLPPIYICYINNVARLAFRNVDDRKYVSMSNIEDLGDAVLKDLGEYMTRVVCVPQITDFMNQWSSLVYTGEELASATRQNTNLTHIPVVLEEHIRLVCQRHSSEISIRNPKWSDLMNLYICIQKGKESVHVSTQTFVEKMSAYLPKCKQMITLLEASWAQKRVQEEHLNSGMRRVSVSNRSQSVVAVPVCHEQRGCELAMPVEFLFKQASLYNIGEICRKLNIQLYVVTSEQIERLQAHFKLDFKFTFLISQFDFNNNVSKIDEELQN